MVALAPACEAIVYAQNAAISQGYQTSDTNVVPDALVSLTSQDTVGLTTINNVEEMVGVVGNKPLVELSNSTSSSQVQVVTDGTAPTLVSDINGPIKTGDKITASPIDGVGMRASTDGQIVGTAQANLMSASLHSETVKDTAGRAETVHVGVIPVQIAVAYFTVPQPLKKAILPIELQNLADGLVGKSVSATRALLAFIVLGLGFISVGLLIYASIRSSIISIGRNPLSHGAINHSLVEIGSIALGILLVMVITIYLILTT
ncbi:MAG TPA: hypothetical protein VGS28_04175 [Candidatus Saccharimonadales bacterium]|nr:hypothetical protein [Candidatus Saccharimonadales bacterium]